MPRQLKEGAPMRTVTEIDRDDFIKVINGRWKRVLANTATAAEATPAEGWIIVTDDGRSYTHRDILCYAKREDME